jgi:hypothetical protein
MQTSSMLFGRCSYIVSSQPLASSSRLTKAAGSGISTCRELQETNAASLTSSVRPHPHSAARA